MSPQHRDAVIIENAIGWCDETTNAVTGCDKVSPGCGNCYAATGTRARVLRAGGDPKYPDGVETWGPKGIRVPVLGMALKIRRLNKICLCDKCHAAHPLKNFKVGEECANVAFGDPPCGGRLRRPRLFADSNSDWLDPKWEPATLAAFLEEIMNAPHVDVQLLTKRPQLFNERILAVTDWIEEKQQEQERTHPQTWPISELFDWIENEWLDGNPPEHLWIGTSVEDQKRADERISLLFEIPARVRFLSVEPLLEDIDLDLRERNHKGQLHWVIVGGESGQKRRDCGVQPILSVASQGADAGIPVYVKQDSALLPGTRGRIPDAFWQLKQFPKSVELAA